MYCQYDPYDPFDPTVALFQATWSETWTHLLFQFKRSWNQSEESPVVLMNLNSNVSTRLRGESAGQFGRRRVPLGPPGLVEGGAALRMPWLARADVNAGAYRRGEVVRSAQSASRQLLLQQTRDHALTHNFPPHTQTAMAVSV